MTKAIAIITNILLVYQNLPMNGAPVNIFMASESKKSFDSKM